MCWVGNLTDVKVADSDITVYKVLMKKRQGINGDASARYLSPFKRSPYSLNVLYSELIEPDAAFDPHKCRISKGLHCYSENTYIRTFGEEAGFSVYRTIEDANFHSTIETYISMRARFPVVVKCIIPRGFTYYENDRGEIVTQKLILKEEIKIPNDKVVTFKDIL